MKRRCDDCPMAGQDPKVRGIGSEAPGIMFVGESPGQAEVTFGGAFSPKGASGRFLHQVLEDLGEDPEDHYFDNVVMCLCKGRTPASKVNVCLDGLLDVIAELEPRLVVPMGNVAAKALGDYSKGISFVRSNYRVLDIDGTKVGILPTYHPAALFRQPDLFRDFLNDIGKAVRIANGEPPVIHPPYDDYDYVSTEEELDRVFPLWEKARVLAIDLETRTQNVFDPDAVIIIGIGYGRGRASAVEWDLVRDSERFKELLETKPLSMQNAMFDLAFFRAIGIDANIRFDTMIAHWLTDERDSGHGLEAMAIQYYNAPPYKSNFRRRNRLPEYMKNDVEFGKLFGSIPRRDLMRYNGADADYTWRLTVDLKKELKEQGMLPLMNLLVDAVDLYTDLYLEGMWVDEEKVVALEEQLIKERDAAEAVLYEYAPDVNPRSPKQLAAFLFDELGLTPFDGLPADADRVIDTNTISAAIADVEDPDAQKHWQTARVVSGADKTGGRIAMASRTTSKYMLYWLAQQHPYPRALIEYREAQKRLKTYIGMIRENQWPDGRVRPEYKLAGNLHGRFRSSNPAIHNLPHDAVIYDLYCAPPGYMILYADYKQVDLRLIFHLSQDFALKEWLDTGDPHYEVAKILRKSTDEEMMKLKETNRTEFDKYRIAAKLINFGLPYGRGADSLAPQLGITVQEAKVWIKDYWKRLPTMKAWMESRGEDLVANGQEYISPMGNRRRFPLILDRRHLSHINTLGVNFPVMSTVNYITTKAHIEVVSALRAKGIHTYVYPHVHDCINVCVPIEDVKKAAKIMGRRMSEVPHEMGFDTIAWPVDVEVGTNWGTRQPVEEWLQARQEISA